MSILDKISSHLEYRRIQRKYGKRRAPAGEQSFPSSSKVEISNDRSEIQRRITENTPSATIRKPVGAPVATTVRKSASMIALPVFGRRKSSSSAAAQVRPEEQRYDGKINNQYRKSSGGSSSRSQQAFDRPNTGRRSSSSMSSHADAGWSSAPVSRRRSYIDPASARQVTTVSRRLSTPVSGSIPATTTHHSKSTTQLPTHYEYSLSTEIDREQGRFRSSVDDNDYQHHRRVRRSSAGANGRDSLSQDFTFRHPQNFDLAQQQQQRRRQPDQQKPQSFLSRKLSLLVGH